MKSRITKGIFLVLMLTVATLPVVAQKAVVMIPSESSMIIQGTSSLHDWEEKVEKFEVTMQLQSQGEDVESLSNVRFYSKTVAVVSENSIMNKKTHDALGADKYPVITFESTAQAVLEMSGNNFKGSVTGDLYLNGVTKRIVVSFTGSLNGNIIEVSGTNSLSMNDYGIKPPTAMLGSLKTGDGVKVSFRLKFKIG